MGNIRKIFKRFFTLLFFVSLIIIPSNTVKAQTSSSTLLPIIQLQKAYGEATLSLKSSSPIPVVPLVDTYSSTAPTLLWNFSAESKLSAPVAENSKVYVGSDSYVYALNINDGSILWNNSDSFNFICVAVANDEVFAAGFNKILAINAKTGKQIWENGVGGFNPGYNTPVVADNVVYGSGNVVGLSAMNAKTGKTIWSFTGGEDISVGVDISNALGMWSSPAIANGKVYIAAQAGIYVLNANNGNELWNSTIAPFLVSPIVTNGVIYAGSSDGNVYALNANNGNKLWNYTTSPSKPPVPWAGDVLAYSNSQDGKFASILYAYSQEGSLYALNATTGEKLWNQTVTINSYPANPPTPVVADNVIYVGSGGGNLYAFDATNGDKLWNYTIEGANNTTLSTPSIVNGVLYVSANNNVYALRVASPSSQSPVLYPILPIAVGAIVVVAPSVLLLAYRRHRKTAGLKQ
jgi:outer membrane protein assembly factor BamB